MTSVTELPFNNFLGIQQASEPGQHLRLPAGAQYLNHLGTVHASAQLGWQRCGVIPNYALWPQGGLCSTTVFYRQL